MKTFLLKVLLGMLAIILIIRYSNLPIGIGLGNSSTCREGTHCYFAGKTTLSDKTIESLRTAGSTLLNNVTVNGDASITGSLTAKQSTFGSLNTNGKTVVTGSRVKGTTYSTGSVTAINSQLGPVEAAQGSLVVLVKSSAESLTIVPQGWSFFRQKNAHTQAVDYDVVLDGSTISGDIVFQDEPGNVIIKNGGSVGGEIRNGTVIRG